MKNPYSYAERDKAYSVIDQTSKLVDLVEAIGTGQEAHDAELQAALTNMTGTSDLQGQHKALGYLLDKVKEKHASRIAAAAYDDFTAFVEVISPDQPCRSKVHRFIGEHFMEMEANPGSRTALSMPPGHAKDLCIETPVMMGDGSSKRLKDIEVGDFVITHTGHAREVLAVHEQGVRDILEIYTGHGRIIRAHPDHPFLTPSGFIPAKDLAAGDVLAQQREFSIANTSGRSLEEFIIAGYMMAYGLARNRSHSRVRNIDTRFRTDDPVIMEDIMKLAKNLGYDGRIKKGMSYGEEVRTLSFAEPFKYWLMDQDLWNVERMTMRVPDWVFKGSLIEIGGFLGAVFSMDAHLKPGRSKHTGAQKQLMIKVRNAGLCKDVRRLMMRVGVRGSIRRVMENCYNYEPTTFWNLVVDQDEDIAFLRKHLRIVGINRRFWDVPVAVRRFFDNRYAEDPIVSIQKAKPAETRCLTVDVDHTFLADGIVVHNSTYGSRLFPAWWIGRRERKKWLQAGHTQKFAEKEFGKKLRDEIIDTDGYRKVFPDVAVRSASVDEIVFTNNCSYVTKGVGQGISGYRSHFNNIDDPYPTEKAAQSPVTRNTVWEWFANDFRTRRLPGAGELIIVTRWHEDDVVGRLEELLKEGNMEPWTIINLPAFSEGEDVDQLGRKKGAVLWPELFTESYLLDQKATMAPSRWQSLYQGSPVMSEGNILQRKWIKYYNSPPRDSARDPENPPQDFRFPPVKMRAGGPAESLVQNSNPLAQNPFHRLRCVISVDSAEKDTVKADYSSIQCWIYASDYKHYLMDRVSGKFEFPELVTQIENMAKKWDADIILVETKGAGNQYLQARQGQAPCSLIPYNPGRDDKTIRYEGTMVLWQAGDVLLPERAPWLEEYTDQLLRFPSSRNDDDVDSTSQYLNWSREDGGWKRGMKKLRT